MRSMRLAWSSRGADGDMKTQYNAIRSFRAEMAALKALKGWTNRDLAAWLGCCESTVSEMYRDPIKSSGRYILLVKQLFREEQAKMLAEA